MTNEDKKIQATPSSCSFFPQFHSFIPGFSPLLTHHPRGTGGWGQWGQSITAPLCISFTPHCSPAPGLILHGLHSHDLSPLDTVGTLKVKPGCNPDPQKILVEPCWIWQQTEITRIILEWKKNQLLNPQFPERNIPDKHLKDHQGLARMPTLLMWKRPCLWISKWTNLCCYKKPRPVLLKCTRSTANCEVSTELLP